ncbi:permease for cytosine/purines, uracil, thiamine, allantoin [Rubrobacter xylanophilus DSM 9941]|uniref:Permease for cytosine/purines, uracil, thiamine, allantoin n=1 Tax=Rubrobacter xylanophilus (strain DSM 9941 / JCM 11954 / NBRC 16129 / PRD-1) TaxID=266117 RepID=Q1ARL8_RUBXD|nr:cytosine permease [Rubrobacter xylanophilus]ABG05960.1 permease for cytosine/purines, uracil, thiamine, allantoin [Rubrobacter xylanophilus DSM 9941]
MAAETHHIDVIPEDERHGRARDLFFVWFAANFNIGNAVFGAVAVFLGNDPLWAMLAVIVGNLLGGVFMAYHSAQGPQLGVPQLIQSRGQFGYYGALMPVGLAVLLYGGFFVLTAVIAGQALTAVFPGLSLDLAIVIGATLSLVLALFGYNAIHRAAQIGTWPLAIPVVMLTVATLGEGTPELTPSGFQIGPFALAVALSATFQLTYAPYVSDYSRYLPSDTKVSATFWWTFLGVTTSVIWTQLIGVLLAFQFENLTTFDAAKKLLGTNVLTAVILLISGAAIAGNNALNLYGGMLNLVPRGFKMRALLILPTFVVGTALAILASRDFIATLTNFLSLLQLTFVPWGAINLTDFYLVKKGRYDVGAFFEPRGPYYRDEASWTFHGIAWKAILCYLVGIIVQVPFLNNAWFKGWLTDPLGGGDFSFIFGLVVPAVLYYVLMRPRRTNVRNATELTEAAGGP